jgi:hypothetical protein
MPEVIAPTYHVGRHDFGWVLASNEQEEVCHSPAVRTPSFFRD